MPMRLGGLGLRSAARTAQAAYWASWADALPMLKARLPDLADRAVQILDGGQLSGTCLDEVMAAARLLDSEGFLERPTFAALAGGARPPKPEKAEGAERGEWPHGWQFFAASTREHHFRRSVVLPGMKPAEQAHLRSHSGLHASSVLLGAPTSKDFEIDPADFRTLVLERLGLPLALADVVCEGCGGALDPLGRHRGACPRSGRLKLRAKPLESAMAAVCREAGASVKTEVRLQDLSINKASGHEAQ